jgi:hypothetical protein
VEAAEHTRRFDATMAELERRDIASAQFTDQIERMVHALERSMRGHKTITVSWHSGSLRHYLTDCAIRDGPRRSSTSMSTTPAMAGCSAPASGTPSSATGRPKSNTTISTSARGPRPSRVLAPSSSASTTNVDIRQRIHLVKFGLNYRFGAGPVVASY